MAATVAPGPRWAFASGASFEVLVRDEDDELVKVKIESYRGWRRTDDGIVHEFGSGVGRRASRRHLADRRIVEVTTLT